MPKHQETVVLSGIVVHTTVKGLLFRDDDTQSETWLPASQVLNVDVADLGAGEIVDIEIPRWLAENEDLL